MTGTEREALIEKAAKAAARAVRGVTAHVGLRDRKYAAAAFAVFEEAHAPTDDERLAAHKEAKRRYGRGEPQVRRRVGFEDGAAWAVARRPVQAEPTDAEVLAAAREYHERGNGKGSFDRVSDHVRSSLLFRMRAALRAASTAGERREEQDHG